MKNPAQRFPPLSGVFVLNWLTTVGVCWAFEKGVEAYNQVKKQTLEAPAGGIGALG